MRLSPLDVLQSVQHAIRLVDAARLTQSLGMSIRRFVFASLGSFSEPDSRKVQQGKSSTLKRTWHDQHLNWCARASSAQVVLLWTCTSRHSCGRTLERLQGLPRRRSRKRPRRQCQRVELQRRWPAQASAGQAHGIWAQTKAISFGKALHAFETIGEVVAPGYDSSCE